MAKLTDAEYGLSREVDAARLLVSQLKEIEAGGDDVLVRDTIEGELNFQQAIELITASIFLEDQVHLDGIANAKAAIASREESIKKRIERKRALIMTAMQIARLKTVVTPLVTISLKIVAPKLIVTDESKIPFEYFKTVDPVVDRAALTQALKSLKQDREAALEMPHGEDRDALLTSIESRRIDGVELSNGDETIQFRR